MREKPQTSSVCRFEASILTRSHSSFPPPFFHFASGTGGGTSTLLPQELELIPRVSFRPQPQQNPGGNPGNNPTGVSLAGLRLSAAFDRTVSDWPEDPESYEAMLLNPASTTQAQRTNSYAAPAAEFVAVCNSGGALSRAYGRPAAAEDACGQYNVSVSVTDTAVEVRRADGRADRLRGGVVMHLPCARFRPALRCPCRLRTGAPCACSARIASLFFFCLRSLPLHPPTHLLPTPTHPPTHPDPLHRGYPLRRVRPRPRGGRLPRLRLARRVAAAGGRGEGRRAAARRVVRPCVCIPTRAERFETEHRDSAPEAGLVGAAARALSACTGWESKSKTPVAFSSLLVSCYASASHVSDRTRISVLPAAWTRWRAPAAAPPRSSRWRRWRACSRTKWGNPRRSGTGGRRAQPAGSSSRAARVRARLLLQRTALHIRVLFGHLPGSYRRGIGPILTRKSPPPCPPTEITISVCAFSFPFPQLCGSLPLRCALRTSRR